MRRSIAAALIFALAIFFLSARPPIASVRAAEALTGTERGEWIKDLRSVDKTNCCAEADGEDVYWDANRTADSGYRVFVDGIWYDVPKGALITEPNRIGKALVWLNFTLDNGTTTAYRPKPGDGRTIEAIEVRCFLPGAAY